MADALVSASAVGLRDNILRWRGHPLVLLHGHEAQTTEWRGNRRLPDQHLFVRHKLLRLTAFLLIQLLKPRSMPGQPQLRGRDLVHEFRWLGAYCAWVPPRGKKLESIIKLR